MYQSIILLSCNRWVLTSSKTICKTKDMQVINTILNSVTACKRVYALLLRMISLITQLYLVKSSFQALLLKVYIQLSFVLRKVSERFCRSTLMLHLELHSWRMQIFRISFGFNDLSSQPIWSLWYKPSRPRCNPPCLPPWKLDLQSFHFLSFFCSFCTW